MIFVRTVRTLRASWLALIATTAILPTGVATAEHRMAVAAGLGITAPANSEESAERGAGIGGFAETSYHYRFSRWVRPSVYSGLHITVPKQDCGGACEVSAQFLFLGWQVRAIVPITYVAPYIETGLGASLGNFAVQSDSGVNEGLTGATYHVPLTLGVMVGERHEFDASLRYLYHPGLVISGGIGLGFGFPLESLESKQLDREKPPWRLKRPPGWHPASQ